MGWFNRCCTACSHFSAHICSVRFSDVCLEHQLFVSRSTFGAPIEPKMVLGGYPTDGTFKSYISDTTALLITIPVNNHGNMIDMAQTWEDKFLDVVRRALIQTQAEAAIYIRSRMNHFTVESARWCRTDLQIRHFLRWSLW
jgi:hypothetical protein